MSKVSKLESLVSQYIDTSQLVPERIPPATGNKRETIVCISDLHGLYARLDLVEQIIKRHEGAEYIVLGGDIFDGYLISKFKKNKELPFAAEYHLIQELVTILSTKFGKVILLDGNHEKGRFSAQMEKLEPTLRFLMKESPFAYLAKGERFSATGKTQSPVKLRNVFYVGEESENSHIYKIGDAIFAHRLIGCKSKPMGNATHIADWFIGRDVNFSCLVTGHSHHVGEVPYKGKLLIDQGCLCYPQEYSAKSFSSTPWDLGYAVVTIDRNGTVDFSKTGAVYLGSYMGF